MSCRKTLKEKITEKLEEWCVDIGTNSIHQGEESSSIFRAPKYLQTNNGATKDFFAPQNVSLGPIHFLKKRKYNAAEIDKSNAVRLLMGRLRSKELFDPLSKFNLEQIKASNELEKNIFIRAVKDEIQKYNDPVMHSMEDECKYFIMFRDTCFLLVSAQEWEKKKKVPHFGFEDISKLENQIPFSLLEKLHEDLNGDFQLMDLKSSFSNFASDLLSYPFVTKGGYKHPVFAFNNLLDCMHQLVMGKDMYSWSGKESPIGTVERSGFVLLPVGTKPYCVIPSATNLSKAGISIKSLSNGGGIRQIHFEKNTSTLHLPKVVFGEFTEVIWRNLIAYELKQKAEAEGGVSRFVHLMNDLVHNREDINLLTKSQVFVARREDVTVSKFWNKLGGKTRRSPFTPIEDAAEAVIKVYDNRSWRILWKNLHLWARISAAAGSFLLLMTAAQVVCLFCKCSR